MPKEKKPPQSAKELLERYKAGERYFIDASLADEDLSGADLTAADLRHAQLSIANLSNTNLTGANLSDAGLTGADLSSANLSGANLRSTLLNGVNLRNACLTFTNLVEVNLTDANLGGANLTEANLSGAMLTEANLIGADLGDATLARTHLLDIDLSPLCDADPPVMHYGPSTVDFAAVFKSIHCPGLKDFLVRTGMPELVAENMVHTAMALGSDVFNRMRSSFISHGHPDEIFARKLYEDLHRNGVRCFLFSGHAVPGQKIGRTVRQGVNDFDRVVLICSRSSLDRKGVMAEIEHSLSREDREGGAELIIPVLLDDYLFFGWSPPHPDVLLTLKDRVAADFRGWNTDPAKFDAGLRKLIMALKK